LPPLLVNAGAVGRERRHFLEPGNFPLRGFAREAEAVRAQLPLTFIERYVAPVPPEVFGPPGVG
jgi:hypothetical protein